MGTAVKIEATNTRSQCDNGHKEYNILKNEVASNVRTRKATFIATLVIACYIDNVASNSAAKACADKQRKASVSQWNITPAALAGCESTAALQHQYGPLSWKPTSAACHIHFKPERDAKAAAAKKEKADKEAAKREKASKDEKKSKELQTKEKSAKEKSNKAVLKVTRHAWHGWINNWDGNMGWHTGGATFVSGLHSTHSNHREDRRWRVLCSTFHGVNIAKSGWPGWQTNWDATWSLSCGHRPMVGMSSYHHNGREDRRWRIRCGTMRARL